MEKETVNFNNELILPVLPEIQRPYEKKFELWDHGGAVVIDKKVILAYKYSVLSDDNYLTNRILISRERTIPIKKEKTGREVIYPYPNQEELKGKYGLLIMSVSAFSPVVYVGEQYKVIYNGFHRNEKNLRIADIKLQSTQPITAFGIDGRCNFNEYLRALNSNS